MNIRYDFSDVLDLNIMRKQLAHYIGKLPEIKYQIYLNYFYIEIDILQNVDDTTSIYHEVSLTMYDLKKLEGILCAKYIIFALTDMRFSELKLINSLYDIKDSTAHFKSKNITDTIEKLCNLIKLLHRMENLKAFL